MLTILVIVRRIIKYFKLDQLLKKKDDYPLMFIHQLRIPKEDYKPKLKLSESTELLISALASLLCMLLCFSVPYVVLISPCEPLKDEGYLTLYNFAKSLEKYTFMMDRIIIIVSILLFIVLVVAITEAFNRIDFNESPWVAMGIYTPPKKKEKKKIQERYVWHFAHFRANV
ncbi:unnamed protein product [Arctia plantaginis]|uniref:Uncharacterized protein n=1 Tax=Arctia plantaginis TaxID=874455 RepID=A0A8S0ZVV3_ARCPL|nr:unnamed protein product [Arctia plantaginis]CAB3238203.1 unnamed protein product [Arctia plantaginis]